MADPDEVQNINEIWIPKFPSHSISVGKPDANADRSQPILRYSKQDLQVFEHMVFS